MRRIALLLAAAATLAACQTEDTPPDALTLPTTETAVAGSYTLSLANGRTVPFDAVVTTAEVWQLTGDKIVLSANGTWVDSTTYVVTNRTVNSTSNKLTASAGTYTIANGQINFLMTEGGSTAFVGAVVSNTLYVNFSGLRYTYNR